jgi:hypothetical protein
MKKNYIIIIILTIVLFLFLFNNSYESFINKTTTIYPIGGNSVNPDMSHKTTYPIGGDSVNPDMSHKSSSNPLLFTQTILLFIIIIILLYFMIR